MAILAIDTTGVYCTTALIKAAGETYELSENIGRGHAERLAPMVQDLFHKAGVNAHDIARIGVCTGPGSFTGLRVGLAFARSFALPRKLPVIGISALEVLAAQADAKTVLSVMDVRRGDVCWALFEPNVILISPVTQPVDDAKADIKKYNFDAIVGDGAHLVSRASEHVVVSGVALAQLAKIHTPKTHPADPLYSRGPDAKLPGGVVPA